MSDAAQNRCTKVKIRFGEGFDKVKLNAIYEQNKLVGGDAHIKSHPYAGKKAVKRYLVPSKK